MSDGVKIDASGVDALMADLAGIKSRLKPAMRAVASRGALNIKNDAKDRILAQTNRKYVKQYPYSITYDITKSTGTEVEAEIGPDQKKTQGPLGVVLEFGTPHNGGPKPHLIPAFDAEVPKFEEQLGIAAEGAVFGDAP